ncbi:MAG: lipoate--protein ligase [Candidatus Atribacteria bacterium]|nr:lipoate--protein ligase [Candidatus Atribacteria bacterium]
MIYIINDSHNPYFNLASEEYIMNSFHDDEKYLMLWQNQPSIIIGKHQNTIEEINSEFIQANNIDVVRRLSGGGAVYHDLGNLNFTFIVKVSDHSLDFDFKKFTEPVMTALNRMGIPAEFNSRNDLSIEGKKFSGNAQYIKKGNCLHHGTLLFNTNLEHLEIALRVSNDKIESKGIKSIRSRVTNIYPYLKRPCSIEEFKNFLYNQFCLINGKMQSISFTEKDKKQIEELAHNKYRTWEWNYGESPFFTIKKSQRFEFGKIEARLDVKQGIIRQCKFYGDFFGREDKVHIENLLIGSRYERNDIALRLRDIQVGNYFYRLNTEQLIQLIIS